MKERDGSTGGGRAGKQSGKRALSLPLLLRLSHSAQLLPRASLVQLHPTGSLLLGVRSEHSALAVSGGHTEINGRERGTLQEMASHLGIQSITGEAFFRAYPRSQV